MRITRKDNTLNDALDVLDDKFLIAQRRAKTDLEAIPMAWDSLDKEETAFIDREIERCIIDRRYFMENYYVIRDETGSVHTLFPWWDHQEIIYEAVLEEWEGKGYVLIIILKPRQAGSTTWNAALIYHATIFVPNSYSLMMAQEDKVSNEIYQRVNDAQSHLPWWMRPEMGSKQQGLHIIYQRTDDMQRITDPGLGSTLMVSNAQKSAGIAIGRTIRNLLGSEVSRWPSPEAWTADIKPSFNAPDRFGILESTAYGRSGLYWNMWRAAEQGKSIWRPVFIPVYKVRKYSLPVTKSENFKLTPEERALRLSIFNKENFKVPLSFFKWRRQEIIETINSTGSEDTFLESYPMTPGEAFISSGFCAFPRKELNRQQREHCRDPILIGEIEYTSMDEPPILHLHKPEPGELLEKPDRHNRFWVWELPDHESGNSEYYASGDVASGEARDFSAGEVFRLGWGSEPDVQVAEWHGKINASHFAKVMAAIGHWYNDAELAIEYTGPGVTTGDELRWTIDYPNLYRWKHMDKVSNVTSQHIHWVTNMRTRDDALNRTNEALLDHMIILRSHHLIEEMRDFGRLEGEGKAQGLDNEDDMVMGTLINVCAARQGGRREDLSERMGMGTGTGYSSTSAVMPKVPVMFAVYDQYGRQIQEVNSEADGNKVIVACEKRFNLKLADIWTIKPIIVSKANTPWSPIFDGQGAERELYDQGMEPRHIRPDIVQSYRDMMNLERHVGSGSGGMDEGDDE